MPARRIVKATFSNGFTMERGSEHRTYTHAYLTFGKTPNQPNRPGKQSWEMKGFSTSEQQCRSNMIAESGWVKKSAGFTVDFAEVVAVEVIEKKPGDKIRTAIGQRANEASQ